MLDTGIQVAHKQTSIESGYNVFDEIAERLDSSVKHWNESSPTSCRDSFAVSLDPANKQRDDGCQGVSHYLLLSSQCLPPLSSK
ncbi:MULTISPECIES: hypothetical protein [Wolbachia]|uniref:hypothetical protein n=1 Tax=Wolbachia TaxID=953 RepID=UPI000FF54E55|nr:MULTISPECIES: hypothetical protein [Wolbachia]MDX5510154.1 hypothetical protein [Wolbachia endosymbiont of Lasioglossum morio]MDX5543258.1 hypothetical protein [Wolbachia endosymbiont of Andrena apicata]MDX5596385.1 hypothetical protein [Wolbachia endosymbiont of Andrena labialis]MBA8766480.1 hypothetical protein [Wolbachia pipientis]MBA8766528.1 hypothetical protein [Wolbachia pipientis]